MDSSAFSNAMAIEYRSTLPSLVVFGEERSFALSDVGL